MSGSQKTTTSGSSAPWAPAQPYLQDAMKAAKVEFDKGPQVYDGSTVVPFANQTVQGMNQMQGVANNAMGAMQNPLQAYTGMMQTLQPIAQGDFSNDTTFMNTLGKAQQDAATNVNLSMSGMGRYGGAAHTDALATSVGDLTNKAMLERQNWASNQLQSYGNALPQAYQTALAPGQTLTGIGGQYENLAGSYLDEQLQKFNDQKNAQWDNIAKLNAIAQGSGQLGGTSSQTVKQPNQMGQQLLGTGMTALGYGLRGGK